MSLSEKEIIELINSTIRNVPDFPKPGILFKDITPLLGHPEALKYTSKMLTTPFDSEEIDFVVGMESRGFLFGPSMAVNLNAGFVPVRKPNKLPYSKIQASYELEYGTDIVEMHSDAIKKGQKVVIHDDLIATGGTAQAASELVARLGGIVVGYSFIIELGFLNGKSKLNGKTPVHSLIRID
jgi:adenine phosphoribosyltransferase